MPLRHVVCLRFADDAPEGWVDDLVTALEALPARIPEIEHYHIGTDAEIDPDNHDLVIVADFADRDAYLTYRDHPVHRRLIEEHIQPILVERAAVQHEYERPSGPATSTLARPSTA